MNYWIEIYPNNFEAKSLGAGHVMVNVNEGQARKFLIHVLGCTRKQADDCLRNLANTPNSKSGFTQSLIFFKAEISADKD